MDKKDFQLFIEAGHTMVTPGKQSPDYPDGELALKETFYCRELVKCIEDRLIDEGIDFFDSTPSVKVKDSLIKRVEHVNYTWARLKELKRKKAALFVSVHCNASGDGSKWMDAKGWSIWTCKGVTQSDTAATMIWEEANKILPSLGQKVRKDYSDGDPDYESDFYVLKHTKIPAVLTENMFQDNKEDVKFLLSEEGKQALVDIHINGIKKYIESL